MKRKILLPLLVIAVLIFTLNVTIPVNADYNGLRWQGQMVYYDMSALSSSWQYQIVCAAVTWSQAGANFSFTSYSGSDNDITTRTMGQYGTLATSGPDVYVWTGGVWYITSTYLTFNISYTFHTDGTEYDLQSVALHEFGHWLYLGHTYSSADVMYGTYDGYDRDLSQADKNFIIQAYGT